MKQWSNVSIVAIGVFRVHANKLNALIQPLSLRSRSVRAAPVKLSRSISWQTLTSRLEPTSTSKYLLQSNVVLPKTFLRSPKVRDVEEICNSKYNNAIDKNLSHRLVWYRQVVETWKEGCYGQEGEEGSQTRCCGEEGNNEEDCIRCKEDAYISKDSYSKESGRREQREKATNETKDGHQGESKASHEEGCWYL